MYLFLGIKAKPCHLAAMFAGHENCSEFSGKSSEKSGAVLETFLYPLNAEYVHS